MAKKEETVSLVDTFAEFKELKNINRTTIDCEPGQGRLRDLAQPRSGG